MNWFWQRLIRSPLPAPAYYWLLDRFTDNNGWRPLSYRESASQAKRDGLRGDS